MTTLLVIYATVVGLLLCMTFLAHCAGLYPRPSPVALLFILFWPISLPVGAWLILREKERAP